MRFLNLDNHLDRKLDLIMEILFLMSLQNTGIKSGMYFRINEISNEYEEIKISLEVKAK